MAKPKEEKNMSALDYLYGKLSLLGNKIEKLSGGKVNKRALLIYTCIGSFIVSVYFGKVIGGFTFVLILITLWNAKITQGLLKQSEEASRQTRQASEIDIFSRLVSSTSQLNAELRKDEKLGDERIPYIENFATGILVTLKNSDLMMFKKISEAIRTWNEIDNRTPATTYSKALDMVEEYQKIEKKELN